MSCCEGPGYATPLAALQSGPREELLYVVCVQPDKSKQDYIATVDVAPTSPTYCQVIHRTATGSVGDELHHSGWNVCSSCFERPELKRDLLVCPSLVSGNVYFVDVGSEPRRPRLHKVIEGSELRALDCSFPHSVHCLASGQIMLSTMGDADERAKGDFVLIDAKTLQPTGTWPKGDKRAKFGYDFWYQPHHDVMVATEWGTPKHLKKGFYPDDVANPERYGSSLNFYRWSTHELIQVIDLGAEGCAPLEVRFLHDPKAAEGFVGCAVRGNVYRFYQKGDGSWGADKVIDIPAKRAVQDGVETEVNALLGDIVLSLDDKFLYLSCWLHGEVWQYDVSDTRRPRLAGRLALGGPPAASLAPAAHAEEPRRIESVKGRKLHGSPQMIQLSLDGKRLYASSSLFSPWDKQFYPQMVAEGGWIVKMDVDTERGGLALDHAFLVHFGDEPDGPALPHEIRYPGGDCTSDIWLAKD